ncbi:DNA polymerase I [Candidatus Parcubacteria bacterium]|nr:MAG: DNA polymerase I [Candidatus Parcubacteria bacterium]
MVKKQKFIVIDGNALIHRAWHALPPLANKKGELTNAVYGFTMVLLKVLKELKPDYAAVTFDLPKPTFRHEEYKEYKGKRKKQPDELYLQFPKVKEIVRAFNLQIFEKEGFEADDVIATIVSHPQAKNFKKIIVTGDLDTLQLVSDDVEVFTMHKGLSDTITYDVAGVKKKYQGLTPEQMIDYKAIVGDQSDNIAGVKGLGETSAIKLLSEFETLDNIYKNINSEKIKDRQRNLLVEHKEEAMQSKRLVTLIRDVPLDFDVKKCQVACYDEKKVLELFRELEFKNLMARLPEVFSQISTTVQTKLDFAMMKEKKPQDVRYTLVDSQEKFEKFISELKKTDTFAVDTELNELDTFFGKLLGISFSWKEKEAYFVTPKAYQKKKEKLTEIFCNPKVKKIGHNMKFDLEVLQSEGFDLQGISFDTMLASYILSPGTRSHSLDNLVFTEFGFQMKSLEDILNKKLSRKQKGDLGLDKIPLQELSDYSCADADFTWRLAKPLQTQLEKNNLLNLLQKIEVPLVPVLAEIERHGVNIDVKFLKNLSDKMGQKIKKLQKKICHLAGCEFNISSPLQLKEVLFDRLKISTKGLGRTKTGISTAADELEKLRGRHPIIELISEYRELSKLKSTYLDALPKLVNKNDKRVHTNYNQTITATGRLSSSDPNLQNIPIRTEVGQQIRKAFVATKGYKILAADYSQIELRIIASLANDKKMIESFNNNEDIHARTAAEINEMPQEKVSKQMRREAKAINFGIIYGMGVYGLAQGAGISYEQAGMFIDKYFTLHSEINKYLDQTKSFAYKNGYVETIFGRRRYLPDINSGVQNLKAAAERAAINHPIQGTAADLMKLAMIEIKNKLPAVSSKAKMIMQVHDELVFEVPAKEVGAVAGFIEDIMNNIYKLRVPIKTDLEAGDNWGEMKSLTQ